MNLQRIGVIGLNEGKIFQKELAVKGVELVLNHNEQTCTRGCSITVEMLALEKDMPIIQELYQSKYKQLLEGYDVDFEAMNSVFDPNQEMAQCPACSTQFSTKASECPECGLFFG